MASNAPVSASTLTRFLSTPVLSKHVVPFLSQPLSKKQDPLWGLNDGLVPDAMLPTLDKAHALTEKLYALLTFSGVSNAFKKASEGARKELRDRIVVEITLIHEGNRGSKALRELVDSGHYLRALRVYFFVKPQALHNFASDKARQEGFARNILHNAAAPNGGDSRISEPFVAFVLAMDLQHSLDLSKQRDCYTKTPLVLCQDFIRTYRNYPVRMARFQRIEQLLIAHEARIVPTPALPFVPEGVIAPPALEIAQSPPALAEPLPAPKEPAPSLLCRICSAFYDTIAAMLGALVNGISKLIR